MSIQPPYYPIIYIRGYAATMSEIEETVATPYMGFNTGSTKIRQDFQGNIVRFIFESPLIRLRKDHMYEDTYMDGDLIPPEKGAPSKSIWIFRYYEPVSEDLGDKVGRRDIPRFAADLRDFIINTVRPAICGKDEKELAAFKVHLVAHSMGGLIARCYLQNICANGVQQYIDTDKTFPYTDDKLELPGDSMVDKVFTYGTPHNGIEMKGINVPDLGGLDRWHIRNFNRSVMREYLDLQEESGKVNDLNGRFPADRFFSLVGTNYRDYQAFFGLSKKVTGEMSDGLVMIPNAVVKGSPRAFVHRSHSGHFGLVNSEEGYQNLRRFLFGNYRVDAFLEVDELTLPERIQEKKVKEEKKIRASYYIETTAQVRQGKYFLHERKVSQASAIHAKYDDMVKGGKRVYLFSGYLLEGARAEDVKDRNALAFSVWLGIQVPVYEIDNKFWFDGHYEGGYIFNDTVCFHFYPNRMKVACGIASREGPGNTRSTSYSDLSYPEGIENDPEKVVLNMPLGFQEGRKHPPRPGFRGKLILEVSKRK